MAAGECSHGGALLIRLLLLLSLSQAVLPTAALRPKSTKRKTHTLDDALIASITAEDVSHNDVMRFVKEGIAHMEALGIKLSDECESRYGYKFITDQKKHHFRLCKSEAVLAGDGTLSGVKRGPSALTKFRLRFQKKQQLRKERLAAAAAATLANATGAETAQRRSTLQQPGDDGSDADADRQGKQRGDERPSYRSQQEKQKQPLVASGRWVVEHGSTENGGNSGAARRHLQSVGNGSSLVYKILKYVNTKKDEDGGGSDVYNDDDDGEDDDDASAAADEVEDDPSTAADADGGTAKQSKRDAWISKRKAALSRVIEPDTELPELTAIGTSHKSSVGCYLQPTVPRNVGYKDAQLACVGRNVVLDSCAFYDGQNDEFDVRFPKPKIGAIKLGCGVITPVLTDRNLTKGYKNRLWWHGAQDNAYDVVRQACSPGKGHVVEHPVAFVLRDRFTHTLHELEVLSTIFTTLAVTNLSEVRKLGVQIVIADQMPHASYRPTYAAISYPYRLRHLAEAPYPPNTCFRTAIFINAFTNSIAFNPDPDTANCFSPVMVGVNRWLRTLHKELDPAYLARVHHHASETGGITRRAVVWTSRRNLEALRLTSGGGMTEWQSARIVPNENQVVAALQASILQWNSRSCLLARYYEGDAGLAGCRDSNVQFDLVFGEFSDWPYYPDQLMTIYRTGILIGVHGAALTFIASTNAGESALLELAGVGWEETQTGNMLNLFPSLAHNMGAYYEQVRYQGPDIDLKIATDSLVRAMDEVSRRIATKQRRMALVEQPQFNDQYNFDIMFPRACPTSVPNKRQRYVTTHPIQMGLNDSSSNTSSNSSAKIT